MIIISVDLSKVDKKFIRTGKNGHSYLNLVVSKRKEVSEYGESHSVAISKSEAERQLDNSTVYVGGGKGYFEDAVGDNALENLTGGDMSDGKALLRTPQGPAPAPEAEADEYEDLPF